jgi:hypothetical protein
VESAPGVQGEGRKAVPLARWRKVGRLCGRLFVSAPLRSAPGQDAPHPTSTQGPGGNGNLASCARNSHCLESPPASKIGTPGADHIEANVVAKIAERIETLETRLKQLKVKQQRVEARKRSLESRRLRRDDTRRKILVGAIVLAKVDQGVLDAAVLNGWLDAALSRADDRALFGL